LWCPVLGSRPSSTSVPKHEALRPPHVGSPTGALIQAHVRDSATRSRDPLLTSLDQLLTSRALACHRCTARSGQRVLACRTWARCFRHRHLQWLGAPTVRVVMRRVEFSTGAPLPCVKHDSRAVSAITGGCSAASHTGLCPCTQRPVRHRDPGRVDACIVTPPMLPECRAAAPLAPGAYPRANSSVQSEEWRRRGRARARTSLPMGPTRASGAAASGTGKAYWSTPAAAGACSTRAGVREAEEARGGSSLDAGGCCWWQRSGAGCLACLGAARMPSGRELGGVRRDAAAGAVVVLWYFGSCVDCMGWQVRGRMGERQATWPR